MSKSLQHIFPLCSKFLPESFWQDDLVHAEPGDMPRLITDSPLQEQTEDFLPDLARIELARYQLKKSGTVESLARGEACQVNPGLVLVQVHWQPLLTLLEGGEVNPQPGIQRLLFWRHPRTGKEHEEQATPADLLALKIVAEQLNPETIARETEQPVGAIDAILDRAIKRGLLIAPPSGLRRNLPNFSAHGMTPEEYRVAETFTLQWHITHNCDLHCRHCYDRSLRDDVSLEQGLKILDQMRTFCRRQQVGGQVSFSGGNPFLHPDFMQLYRAAHERNLNLAILGNPVSESQLEQVLQIARPAFYQVSLEGLLEHNDLIRGQGSFASVLSFLDLLREKQVYSMVMLTLTRANLDQVLPLAEILRDRVDLFTFNRLAMVGEGANLETPGSIEYEAFIGKYLQARKHNPAMALKDNLINIKLEQDKQGLFGGCTGYGCGAAFNFVSLLPDGQVHACRKFPSPIGDINHQSLAEIYFSAVAGAYRNGCRECAECRLRAICGGCLAVAYGCGLDPLKKKDPGCFLQ